MVLKFLIPFSCALCLVGCVNHYNPQADEKFVLSKAQNQLKKGMSSSEVVEVMGSPNIITTDRDRNETWVYDKISSQTAKSYMEGGFFPIIAGIGGSSESSAKSQRTLTVIIKFDDNKMVKDISYHSSSF